MNVQKVRDAIKYTLEMDAIEGYKMYPESVARLTKALAEFDKPVASGPIYVPDAWEKEAEKYHQRECVKCQKVAYCEKCGDPISVGYCENCIPEERKA